MAAPAPAPAWKVVVRQRVVSAQDFVRRAQNELQLVKAFLEMPVAPEIMAQGHAPWTAAFRLKLVLASERLTEATRHLNSAAACMEAAELLALHGGSRDHVSLPLQSIDDLRPREAALRVALQWLDDSCVGALEACEATMWCAGHLSTQIALVDTPAIPDYVGAEQDAAYGKYLTDAIQQTAAAWDDVTTALRGMRC